ncbi:rho GTPase-activating protein 11A isoform X2 [Nematostella vectensis]|uniref:rho GTPase-activating protein 11A isoform X2 n=1 Tax=Nematostella vectensis TaxID=45351 RepID=UPI00207714A3|nr:rho GTPase-activating protein 11A isoform X2 [Nematostella vectensis]
MRDLCSIDFKDSVRFVVRRDLKRLGLKVPKYKAVFKQGTDVREGAVFGALLDNVPSENVGENYYCSVPKFLVDSAKFLRQHMNTEGLFRKSGSVQRQKLLKERIELGEEISTAQPHDVAGLMKQFFRQLQEPLLTNTYHDSFIKTMRIEDDNTRTKAMLYICLLLPLAHLQALKYTMKFLAEFASHSEKSKMGFSNLAIVLTPNLMHNIRKDNSSSSERLLKDQTVVIKTLLKNAGSLGMVPDDVFERAKLIGDDGANAMTSSGDELDSEDMQQGKGKRASRQRTRTGSITGFIGQSLSKFKGNSTSTKTPVRQHRRSKSVKAELLRNKQKSFQINENILSKDDTEIEKITSQSRERMSLRIHSKRRLMDSNLNSLSPANKRRLTAFKSSEGDSGIGNPVIMSRSTQMFATSMKPLTPVKPLADMVKKDHAKTLLSSETEHVKVVDAATYVPSPDTNTPSGSSRFYAPSPCTEHSHPQPAPVSAGHAALHGHGGVRGRRVTRRNSSGATSCFSSSPRSRSTINNPKTQILQDVNGNAVNKNNMTTPNTQQFRKRPSHGSNSEVTTKVCPGSVRSRIDNNESMTPCKYRIGTPPNTSGNRELKAVLSQNI